MSHHREHPGLRQSPMPGVRRADEQASFLVFTRPGWVVCRWPLCTGCYELGGGAEVAAAIPHEIMLMQQLLLRMLTSYAAG